MRIKSNNFTSRLVAIIAMASFVIYGSFLIVSYNPAQPVFSLIFIIFDILMILVLIIYIINNWTMKVPQRKLLEKGNEPHVITIIPTWKEPAEMVEKTILSVLNQDYPVDKITLILSDDARNPLMKNMLYKVAANYPTSHFVYHLPPEKSSTLRRGEGKAGNLNSALDLIINHPNVKYIETRDADDMVGSPLFLRDLLGQLKGDPKLAFVQSIKTVISSKGDPFGNGEDFFYKSLMFHKNGAGAAFSCGSGIVWRKDALVDLGGFPTWNLVEDFQSGAEVLRRKWKTLYLPIIGAVGQISPEDLPNLYKQRGTWAMDSLRFMFYGNMKGLNLRQRLHFMESGILYIITAMSYFYAFLPGIFLILHVNPIRTNFFEFEFYHLTYFVAIITFTIALANKSGIPLGKILRSFQILFGLGPVYFRALVMAIKYGPDRKPSYKVTRKTHRYGLYISLVIPNLVLVAFLLSAVYFNVKTATSLGEIDFSNIAWAFFFIFMHHRIILNSWYKWNPIKNLNFFANRQTASLNLEH